MDFNIVLRSRHSIRVFTEAQIPAEDLEAIVADAKRTPSWCNAQEWKVWIATGRAMKCIREEYISMVESRVAPKSDIAPAPRSAWSAEAQKRMAEFNDQIAAANLGPVMGSVQETLYNAPAIAVLTVPKNAPVWAMFDLGSFVQTLTLAAADRDLGTCVSWNIVKYPEILRKHLEIPADQDIVIGVAIGHEGNDDINKIRSDRELTYKMLTIKD